MDRPTISQLYTNIKSDFKASSSPLSITNIFSSALAGALHMLYGFAEAKANQMLPNSNDSKILDEWGSLLGVPRKPAYKMIIEISLTSSKPVLIEEKTEFVTSEGDQFISTEQSKAVVSEENHFITLRLIAREPGPKSVKSINLAQPIPHVDAKAKWIKIVSPGFGVESDQSLKKRIENRLRYPPHGGSVSDYIDWLTLQPGITDAWVFPRYGHNAGILLAFLLESSFPSPEKRDEIRKIIQKKCPATAFIQCPELAISTINLRIRVNAVTEKQKENLKSELSYMVKKIAKPKGYQNESLDQFDGSIHLSHFHKAISLADIGEYEVIKIEGNEPTAIGSICRLGDVSLVI